MTKHHFLIRIMHWTIGILIIGMLILGYSMGNFADEIKWQLYGLHKAIGFSILVLMLVRIIVKISTEQPVSLKQFGMIAKLLNFFARFIHFAFYPVIIGTSLSGYVMSSAAGRSVKWFFDIEIPMLIDKNPDLASAAKSAHELLVIVVLVLLGLHVLGFIKHLIIDKENILKRII